MIGVSISGGGAKIGFAIGVLEVMEETDIFLIYSTKYKNISFK